MDRITILKAEIFDLNVQINILKGQVSERLEELNKLTKEQHDQRNTNPAV